MNDVGEPCAGEPHARFDRGPLAATTTKRGPLVPGRCAEKRHPMAWSGPQPQQTSSKPVAYLTELRVRKVLVVVVLRPLTDRVGRVGDHDGDRQFLLALGAWRARSSGAGTPGGARCFLRRAGRCRRDRCRRTLRMRRRRSRRADRTRGTSQDPNYTSITPDLPRRAPSCHLK